MQFASKKIRTQVTTCTSKTQGKPIHTPYIYFHNKNKQKYRECLSLIQTWSQDLLERENNLHKLQQKCTKNYEEQDNQSIICTGTGMNKQFNKENKSSNVHMNGSSIMYGEGFDLEEILSQEFVKKMESLYMKQFMLRDFQGESRKAGDSYQENDSLN